MRESGIADLGVPEIQFLELPEVPRVLQSSVCDVIATEVQRFKLREAFEMRVSPASVILVPTSYQFPSCVSFPMVC